MIKSRRRSDHTAIEYAFNCIVATILPFPGIGRCWRDDWLARRRRCACRDVEQRRTEHSDENAAAYLRAISETKVLWQLDGSNNQRSV